MFEKMIFLKFAWKTVKGAHHSFDTSAAKIACFVFPLHGRKLEGMHDADDKKCEFCSVSIFSNNYVNLPHVTYNQF